MFDDTTADGDVGDSIARLAAVHAALDPRAREWQHDILVSAIQEVLSRRPGLSVRGVTDGVCQLWCTKTLTEPLVAAALETAFAANVVRREVDLTGNERWTLSDLAEIAAQQDRKFGDAIYQEFVDGTAQRLDDFADERVNRSKAERVARAIVAAIATAADGLYPLLSSTLDPSRLRPVGLETGRVIAHVKATVEPRPLSRAAVEVALAALDPDDSFGNDIVRLLAVGNLLYAFATRRDVPQKPDLRGNRILLDTSVVIDLSADEGSTEHRVVRAMIERSVAAGVEVVVPEHVLNERRRVWDAAEGEAASLRRGGSLGGAEARLIRNPFSRFFIQELEVDPDLTWGEYSRRRRDVQKFLSALGVIVRPHGNNRSIDRELAEAIRDGLTDGDQVPERLRRRSRRSAEADGQSIAMVDRWRNRLGADRAFFISRGKWPERVYENLKGTSSGPIEINPEAWTLFLASVSTEDPSERSKLAEMVADSAVRSSFFSMASGYTLEEAQVLSDRIREDGRPMSVDESRAALQLTLLDLIDEADIEGASLEKRAAAVIQRRQIRQNSRVIREKDGIASTLKAAEDAAAAKVAVAAERTSAAEERAASAELAASERARGERKYKRLLVGSIPAVLLLVVAVALLMGDVFNGWMFVLVLASVGYYGVQLSKFAADSSATAASFVTRSLTEFLLLAVIEIGAGSLT